MGILDKMCANKEVMKARHDSTGYVVRLRLAHPDGGMHRSLAITITITITRCQEIRRPRRRQQNRLTNTSRDSRYRFPITRVVAPPPLNHAKTYAATKPVNAALPTPHPPATAEIMAQLLLLRRISAFTQRLPKQSRKEALAHLNAPKTTTPCVMVAYLPEDSPDVLFLDQERNLLSCRVPERNLWTPTGSASAS